MCFGKKNSLELIQLIMTHKGKTWEFTIFDYQRWDIINFIKRLDYNRAMFAEEVCPSTGNQHLQGRITFKRAYTKNSLLKLFGDGDCADPDWIKNVTVQPTLASQDWNYYKKLGSIIVIDENRGKQGQRNDLQQVADDIKANKELREIIETHPVPYIKYHTGIEKLHRWLYKPKEKKHFKVEWVWGPPGKGKSRYCRQQVGENRVEFSQYDYFRGYTDHKKVIFSDLRPSSMAWEFLLNLLDPYFIGYIPCFQCTYLWLAEEIYINAPMHPTSFASMKTAEDQKQLLRRIHFIKHIETDIPDPDDIDLINNVPYQPN